MIRIIVAILPKVINSTITMYQFNPLQIANSWIMANNLLHPADMDKGVKFLYDKIHTMGYQAINNGVTAKEQTKCLRLWIKRKRANDIVFNTNSTD